MKPIVFYTLIFFNLQFLVAQNNLYRTAQNPYYWQNKKPNAAYWQQDVHYKIKANIDEKTDVLTGNMQLTYWNNSSDTLYEAFFHLYENAFQPCSYYHNLHENNHQQTTYGKYESQCLGTTVDSIQQDGIALNTELDNTILKVKLNKPLLPNSSTTFKMQFKTYYDSGSVRRRNKTFKSYGFKHYDGTHWYPIISMYDEKFKWTTDQHLGREFYANFGTFDVELTFANNFIVEATGLLQNKNEVLPDSLRKKLDIINFKNKPLESKPSIIIAYDSTQRKTWIYHAENVHNFAFTADPTYRIGEAYTKDSVLCVALVQEPHAANWQPVADYTVKVIELFSKDFGQYAYPKMVVADARDGMEYPMLTLCGNLYPSNKSLIAHEVGHNWFYGMIGSNETYRAMMDEGFTQFITVWALDNIKPDSSELVPKKKTWENRFDLRLPAIDTRAYLGYMLDAVRFDDMPLNTHSDMFNGSIRQGGGYRHVYSKTATMLFNLQYVLGDTLFQKAMKHYFNQWKMAHPYPEDFRSSIIDYTKTDLNWFFDQWMETTKNIDYKVGRIVRSNKAIDNNTQSHIAHRTSHIVIKRKGEMQMPLDIDVITKNKDTLHYYIPNTWFEKKTDATILKRWIGWQKLQPTYTANISLPSKIKDIIIDPSNRLADINMMNNSKRAKVQWHWDAQVYHTSDWCKYHIYTRPELWWNAIDGLKLGWHFNGNYMQYKHQFAFSFWLPTGLAQPNFSNYELSGVARNDFDKINYRFHYETGLNKWVKGLSAHITTGYVEGLEFYNTGITQKFKGFTVAAFVKLLSRPFNNRTFYVLNDIWGKVTNNFSFNLQVSKKYNYTKGSGFLTAGIRTPFVASDYNYSYIETEKKNYTQLWRLELRTRFYARIGFSKDDNLPLESMLNIYGTNNEDLMDMALLRSKGFIPPSTTENFNSNINFQQGGGLNIRALAAVPTITYFNNNTIYNNLGLGGFSFNAELDIDGIVKWQPKKLKDWMHIDAYLFADAGMIQGVNQTNLSSQQNYLFNDFDQRGLVMDAGIGLAFTLKKFGALEKIKPFTLRFDLPLWVGNTGTVPYKLLNNRVVFGLNRSF